MPSSIPVALTIAGSDSGGGAGVQADLKTFAQFGVFGTSAITAITVQNTLGVQAVEVLSPDLVGQQISSVLSDFPVSAVKTGMLADTAVIDAVVAALSPINENCKLVVDPVMVATSGDRLLSPDAERALIDRLLPRAFLITPNIPEAACLLGEPEARTERDMERQLEELSKLGDCHVLLKGGHLESEENLVDLLYLNGVVHRIEGERIAVGPVHGTGCTLAAAIAAQIARRDDVALEVIVGRAVDFVRTGIKETAALLSNVEEHALGHGAMPIHHALKKGED